MSLLDGLKDSMKNPLAENNNDMEFVLESDFELALEKATDVKLSPEDIRAILNGDDDIDDEEDDLDNPGDDVDKDYTSELEACKEALEATITELGIDTAGDEICEDDDLDDPELDPEGEDEILSEEALLAEIESIGTSDSDVAIEGINMDTAKMIRSEEVKKARQLIKSAKRSAKNHNYDEAVQMLDEAEDLIVEMKKKVAQAREPKGIIEKGLSYLTPIFSLLPSGETKLTGVSFSSNGDIGYSTTTTFYDDEYSLGTDSQVKKELQLRFNLLLKNLYATRNKYKSLSKTQKKDSATEAFFDNNEVFLMACESEEEELIAECESLIADMPEDDEPPADDSAMESPNPGADKNTKVKGIVESDDESDDDDEDESEEDEDSDKHKHHEECEDDDDECEKKHYKHHDHDEDDEDESEDDDEKESDDDDEKKDKKEKEDDDDEDEEAEESTLESILDNLLGVPM